ncbi:unnamed protein product [Bemisia tabaci]|uniref:F-box domain-containing protein n=1 Tax=Bemisia tabaci TaxID=7038 RepID=A0A9P0A7G4_BEMTA|nr:unnamed protein product [Bemisia tabaci]
MDERNGDCFHHHDALFAPTLTSGGLDSDHETDCLKDFLLEPTPVPAPTCNPTLIPSQICDPKPNCLGTSSSSISQITPMSSGPSYGYGTNDFNSLSNLNMMQQVQGTMSMQQAPSMPSMELSSFSQKGNSWPPVMDPFQNQVPSPLLSNFPTPSPVTPQHIPDQLELTVNGSITSPAESNRNGECSSVSDCVVSPLTPASQLTPRTTGSERSIETETTPGSERSVNSDKFSPRVELENLEITPETSSNFNVSSQIKSEKEDKRKYKSGRKRKSESSSTSHRKQKHSSSTSAKSRKPTYQSEIAPDVNGIKIKISLKSAPTPPFRRRKNSKKAIVQVDEEPKEQSVWGEKLPDKVLKNIFRIITETDGCIPFLVRVSRVCRLWRRVASDPTLWHNIDLSSKWVSKNPIVNELNFRWLCENRLANVQELNLGGWKFNGIPAILDKITSSCTDLCGLSLQGWEGLSSEHLRFLLERCKKLQRLDLSGINPQLGSKQNCAVSLHSLLYLAEEMGERCTSLILSNNRLSGIPQIINALATHCPNLQLLDMSNVRTVAMNGLIHIEKLQEGCQKLRVFRITNSQFALAVVPLIEQAASPGFPLLEELSAASNSNTLSTTTEPMIDDESLERLLKNAQKLRLLDVRGCSRVTDSSLVRVSAWDLTHLYLSGSYVTRNESGLDLICQKWSHSLTEVDLAWSTNTRTLDTAVSVLAEQAENSPLRVLDLTGSSVSLEPVKAVLTRCPLLASLNLTSCRGLPRGIKRAYKGHELVELRNTLVKEDEKSQDESQESNTSQEKPNVASPSVTV